MALTPTPPLVATPSPAPADSLAVRINKDTRQIHADVNRLITARVPLALPPYSPTPALYLHGISTVSQLYFSFEDAWQELICTHISADKSPRLATYLSRLIDPRLWRTARLERDIAHLRKVTSLTIPVLNPKVNPVLVRLKTRIPSAVGEKPHLLLAYAWVLYMAIFAGGRHIRAQLGSAGLDFWRSHSDEMAGRNFFSFPGELDGEDIKVEFKRRFGEADGLLSEVEKEDVVAEATWVFEAVKILIAELDEYLGTEKVMVQDKHEAGEKHTKATKGDGATSAAATDDDIPSWAAELAPYRKMDVSNGQYVTEGMGLGVGICAILAGLATWYGLWLLGPKQALLEFIFGR